VAGAETGAALAELARRLAQDGGGRPVPVEKIHLTLAFLGDVTPERMPAVLEAATLRARRFEGAFDQVGSFRRAGVPGPEWPIRRTALLGLQRKLASRLREAGVRAGGARIHSPCHPGAANARAIPRAAIAPIAWTADALTLVRSETGTGRYSIVESWPLRA
jgi:2'-5' RNA ligase